MRFVFLFVVLLCAEWGHAQELYVYSEPASNMPSGSLGVKLNSKWIRDNNDNRLENREMIQCMLGLSNKWMVHVAGSFSNMYSQSIRWESVKLYTQYRFFSNDELHCHFRMAAYGNIVYSRNAWLYDEITSEGDQPQWQLGFTATQLLHKLALSGGVSWSQVMRNNASKALPSNEFAQQAVGCNFSAGYLLFPKKYTSYKQTNINLYYEWMAQSDVNRGKYFIDCAPALQFIFNSSIKLNLGYRFQVSGNMQRMARSGWLLGADWTLLNVF